jgi:RNase P/RNase MRP subunit POP5
MKKRVIPALREKKRYLVFEIIGNNIDFDDFKEEMNKSFLNLLGVNGFSLSKPWLIKDYFKNNKGILKIERPFVPEAKMCLALIREINKKEIIVFSKKVFGSLKKARNNL